MTGMTLKTVCVFAATTFFCGTAFAQESGQANDSKTTQEVELPLGEPVGPKLGEPYDREKIVDWTIRCFRARTPDAENCLMYQLLKNADGSDVAEVIIGPRQGDAEAPAVAQVTTPLGTMLQPGLVFSVELNEPFRYPFVVCGQKGCISEFRVANELHEQMRSGSTASFEIVAANSQDRPLFLSVSLSGFSRAFDALIEQDAKNPQ